jgi:hypothetical protein
MLETAPAEVDVIHLLALDRCDLLEHVPVCRGVREVGSIDFDADTEGRGTSARMAGMTRSMISTRFSGEPANSS